MSNVLIGIIGVILFIGLALAGALFLGPRFQEATLNSKASATVQAVSQLASAAQMYRVQEGTPFVAGSVDELKTKSYIKAIPGNPANPAWTFDARTEDGNFGAPATNVGMGIPNTEQGKRICAAIAKQVGQSTPNGDPESLATYPARPVGCFLLNADLGTIERGLYIAFARI
jgi:type II secretory pathway pseudopilin PulG